MLYDKNEKEIAIDHPADAATMRDVFAMHAPPIAMQSPSPDKAAEMLANWAYIYADAMLRRRSK